METTRGIKDEKGKTIKFEVIPEAFYAAVMKAKGKPVVFVTIFGSYQNGKSTTIKLLTRDERIRIGNGVAESTTGAFMYGPISFNDFRKRFGKESVEGDETQIFFIDTEGSDGFTSGSGNTEVNRLLIIQLIAPYASISNVLISMFPANVTIDSATTIKEIIDIVNRIRKGLPADKVRTHLISLISNFAGYKPSKFDKFQNKCMKEIIKKKLKFQDLGINEAIPLSQYDINKSPYEQDAVFNEGFKIFAQHVIQHIEASQKDFKLEAEDSFQMFQKLANLTEEQQITQIIDELYRQEFQKGVETKCSQIVDQIINEKIEDLQKLISDIQDKLNKELNVELPKLNENEINNELFQKLDKALDPEDKTLNIYPKFKLKIVESISKKFQEINNIYNSVKNQQIKFVKQRIFKLFNDKNDQLEAKIDDSDSNKILNTINFNEIKDEIDEYVHNFYQEKNIHLNDIEQLNINDFIDEHMNILKNNIEQYVNEKIEKNIQEKLKETEERIELIVSTVVKHLANEIKSYNINQLNEITPKLKDKIYNNCLQYLEEMPNKKIRKIINDEIVKNLSELNTIIAEEKAERIKTFNENVKNKYNDIIGLIKQKENESENIINSKNDIYNLDEIINLSNINNIESEINNELTNIEKYIDEHAKESIKTEIKNVKSNINNIAKDKVKKNINKYIDENIQVVVQTELNNIQNSIQNNKIPTDIQNELLERCVNSFIDKSRNVFPIDEKLKQIINNKVLNALVNSSQFTNLPDMISHQQTTARKQEMQNAKNSIKSILTIEKMSAKIKMQNSKSCEFSGVFPSNIQSTLSNKFNGILSQINEEKIKSEIEVYIKNEISNCVTELSDEAKIISRKNKKEKEKFEKEMLSFLKDSAKAISKIK